MFVVLDRRMEGRERWLGREDGAKHELFPAPVVQKPRPILFPTIHNALSIINRVRNREGEESILFLEDPLPRGEALL